MQLLDAGQQLATRPAANPLLSPGWANNAPASSPPTIADPDTINAIMAELLQFLTLTGQAASKTNVGQVATAAMMLFGVYGVDSGGTANQYVINPGLPLPALRDGQRVLFRTTRPSTAAATLQVGSLSAQPIVFNNGSGGIGAVMPGANEVFWDAGSNVFRVMATPVLGLPGAAYEPGGLLKQWGTGTAPDNGLAASAVTVTFPFTFPNAIFGVVGAANGAAHSGIAGGYPSFSVTSMTVSNCIVTLDTLSGTTFNQAVPFTYLAWGY